jgi:murein DD-endopeptidase MepM/ murein hydrolase activator NlpD
VTGKKSRKDERGGSSQPKSNRDHWFKGISWVVTGCLVVSMVAVTTLHIYFPTILAPESESENQLLNPETDSVKLNSKSGNAQLPEFSSSILLDAIAPIASYHTIYPTRPREVALKYTVTEGDSIFSIAKQFNLKPETILWANYETLKDNPDMLSIGMDLIIPPTDGIYYQWLAGDSLDSVAGNFNAKIADILAYPGNGLDMTDPVIKAGNYIMIPGGSRAFLQWLVPTIPRGKAGVAVNIIGAGACDTSTGGYYGSGYFVWPAGNHYLSGNDYSPWHLGIDIAAGMGAPVFAADSGLVVYSGWSTQGYGNLIVIDHGNGYQTLYGHLSTLFVSCGEGVFQGEEIALSGSTGNSTGPHLHFEVRYMGGFINPWNVLP